MAAFAFAAMNSDQRTEFHNNILNSISGYVGTGNVHRTTDKCIENRIKKRRAKNKRAKQSRRKNR